MTTQPPDDTDTTPDGRDDIVAETERFLLEIAGTAGLEQMQAAFIQSNARLATIRQYEAAFIPDRLTELQALKHCWAARDIDRLKVLILAYYQRRKALAGQIADLMNRPN